MDKKDLIRKRKSYQYFRNLYNAIISKSPFQVLKLMHQVIDNYRGFHSQYNADCALESIDLLRKDIKRRAKQNA